MSQINALPELSAHALPTNAATDPAAPAAGSSGFAETLTAADPSAQHNEEVHGANATSDDRRREQAPLGQAERRNSAANRRLGIDRRVVDIGSPTGLERRRGPGRRRSDDRRSAEEGEMTDEQFEFMLAIDTYKRLNNRPFPSWTEVLEVAKQLGYRKVAPSTITLSKATGRSV